MPCWNSNSLAQTEVLTSTCTALVVKTELKLVRFLTPTSRIAPQNTEGIKHLFLKKVHAVFTAAISNPLTRYKANTDFIHEGRFDPAGRGGSIILLSILDAISDELQQASLTECGRRHDCPGSLSSDTNMLQQQ